MANEQVHVDFLENGRGGFYLLKDGYKYSIKSRRNDRCYWRCVNRDCRATLTTLNNIPISFGQEHNHPSDYLGLGAAAFINSVKKRCCEDVSPVSAIYDEELQNLRPGDADEDVENLIGRIPTFYSCKTALYHSRSKTLPKLPATRTDIDLQGEWTETLAGQNFLICDDNNDRNERIIIFATDDNLRKLSASTIVIGDGTFYTSPKQFTQLYTLHGCVDGSVFPLVFELLPNKREETYTRFLTLLREAAFQKGIELAPETVLLDFENAVWSAVETVFPGSTLRGCFFHYCQCIWRKVQGCGIAVRYTEDENLKRLVRRAAVLPLVPPANVEDVWFNALEENNDNSPEVTRFTDYVTETWVEGRHQGWNHFDNNGPRTTNNAEGWHSKLNRLCKSAHPNIYSLLRLLQRIQASNEARQIQLRAGGKQRPRDRKYRQLDARLCRLKERLTDGQSNIIEYADAASHLVHLE